MQVYLIESVSERECHCVYYLYIVHLRLIFQYSALFFFLVRRRYVPWYILSFVFVLWICSLCILSYTWWLIAFGVFSRVLSFYLIQFLCAGWYSGRQYLVVSIGNMENKMQLTNKKILNTKLIQMVSIYKKKQLF